MKISNFKLFYQDKEITVSSGRMQPISNATLNLEISDNRRSYNIMYQGSFDFGVMVDYHSNSSENLKWEGTVIKNKVSGEVLASKFSTDGYIQLVGTGALNIE